MTFEDVDKIMVKMHEEEMAIAQTKGREYTQGDRLDNFKRIAAELGINPKKVLWVYLKKHLDSIASYIKNEQVLSEPIEGRIMDARVYLALLRGLIEEERKEVFSPALRPDWDRATDYHGNKSKGGDRMT